MCLTFFRIISLMTNARGAWRPANCAHGRLFGGVVGKGVRGEKLKGVRGGFWPRLLMFLFTTFETLFQ